MTVAWIERLEAGSLQAGSLQAGSSADLRLNFSIKS